MPTTRKTSPTRTAASRRKAAAPRRASVFETARKEVTAPRIAAAVGLGALAAVAGYFSSASRRESAAKGAKDLYSRTRARAHDLKGTVRDRLSSHDPESNIVEGKFAAA